MPNRNLSRRDYWNSGDSMDFRRGFDDYFSRMFSGPFLDRWTGSNNSVNWIPPIESFIDQNRFHVRLALPGVKPSEVNVQAHGGELSISGERKQDFTPSDERTFQREFTYGSFERVIALPEGVQGEKIEANFVNGVLEVTAPLSEKSLPRRIEIKSSAGSDKRLAA